MTDERCAALRRVLDTPGSIFELCSVLHRQLPEVNNEDVVTALHDIADPRSVPFLEEAMWWTPDRGRVPAPGPEMRVDPGPDRYRRGAGGAPRRGDRRLGHRA